MKNLEKYCEKNEIWWFFKINDEKIINYFGKLLFEALQIRPILFLGE